MKAEELMIGDFVKGDSNAIGKIVGIDGNHVKIDSGVGYAWFDPEELLPIPINPEILEKIGFVTKDEEGHWTGYRIFNLYDNGKCKLSVQLYHKVKTDCEISLNSAPYWICLKYIHELQHLIRLCGINNEIVI